MGQAHTPIPPLNLFVRACWRNGRESRLLYAETYWARTDNWHFCVCEYFLFSEFFRIYSYSSIITLT